MHVERGSAHILILGGTSEANALVERLHGERPDLEMTLSLAGRTRSPRVAAGARLRSGSFGGAEGLARFMRAESVDLLIDATHPYAARISANASKAAIRTGIALAVLRRSPWPSHPGWISVRGETEACATLPAGARPFVALGSQHLSPFAARTDIAPVFRMIEAPPTPPGRHATILFERAGNDVESERELLLRHRVTHLVCRNSGGGRSYAKVDAAMRLSLPVVMIERVPTPENERCFAALDDLVEWIGQQLGAGPAKARSEG